MFININDGGIYYFDSVGTDPPKEIQILSTRSMEQGNSLIFDKGLKISNKHILLMKYTVKNGNIQVNQNDKQYLYEGAIIYFVEDGKQLSDHKPFVISKINKSGITVWDRNKR